MQWIHLLVHIGKYIKNPAFLVLNDQRYNVTFEISCLFFFEQLTLIMKMMCEIHPMIQIKILVLYVRRKKSSTH